MNHKDSLFPVSGDQFDEKTGASEFIFSQWKNSRHEEVLMMKSNVKILKYRQLPRSVYGTK